MAREAVGPDSVAPFGRPAKKVLEFSLVVSVGCKPDAESTSCVVGFEPFKKMALAVRTPNGENTWTIGYRIILPLAVLPSKSDQIPITFFRDDSSSCSPNTSFPVIRAGLDACDGILTRFRSNAKIGVINKRVADKAN